MIKTPPTHVYKLHVFLAQLLPGLVVILVQNARGGLTVGAPAVGWDAVRVGKVDKRLPGKGNSNSRGARPVYSFR